MKKFCVLSAALLLMLVCTNRQDPVGNRDNPWDSGGSDFIYDGKPVIKARIDSTVWYDFNHTTGLGTIKASYTATDPNKTGDTLICRFFIRTGANPVRQIFAQPDSTLFLDQLRPGTMYQCSLSVKDAFDSSAFFILKFGTPLLTPPLPPVPSLVSNGDTIKISWKSVASATGYRIYSTDSLSMPFALAAYTAQPDKGAGVSVVQPFYFKTPGSKYFIVASFNQGGESRSKDTLFGIIMSKNIAPPAIESVSKGTYRDYIKVVWHANDASATGFDIYRSQKDTLSFIAIKRVGAEAGQNVYIDSVSAVGNYYYKITAINKQGYSSYFSTPDYGFISRIANAAVVTISATSRYIGLYWNPVPGAFRYIINRNVDSCGAKPLPLDTTTLLFFNDSVSSANTFYYSVTAIDSLGTMGPRSNCVTGSLDILPGPKGLQINNQTRLNALTLSWEALQGAKSYSIYRSTVGCPVSSDGIYTTTTSTTFIDTAVLTTATYFYKVAAVDSKGRTGSLSTCSYGSLKRLSSPTNLVVSNGSYPEYISLKWDTLTGAQNYAVYRSSVSCWESKIKIVTTATTSYIDRGVSTSNMYYYTVAGIDASGAEGSPSSCMQGWVRQLSAPTNLTASQGEYAEGIRLSWNAVEGATGYIVYSGTSSSVDAASVRTTVTSTTYFDSVKTTATMYYWVAATNRLGTGIRSIYAYGSIVSPPVLTVTQYTSSVILSWKVATGSSSRTYVRRSIGSGAFTVIDSTAGSTYVYSDNPPDYRKYNYQIALRLTNGSMLVSNTVTGYRLLSPPTGLKTTDKKSSCLLQWNRVSGATTYKVYRSETSTGATLLTTVTDTLYTDVLTSTIRYYYRVSSVNSDQESSTSSYVIGGILQTPAAPTSVRATSTTYAITLLWDIAAGSSLPSGYYINRLNNKSGLYELLDSTTTTTYRDSVKDSATYYYRIAAYNQSGTSALSAVVSAKLQAPLPPTSITASLGLYSSYVRISWVKVAGVDSYGIYRSTSSSGVATKIGASTDSLFLDTSAVPNTRYYYRVSSIRKGIEGSTSTQASGLRLGPPGSVSASARINGIYLSWTSSPVSIQIYYIYRATAAAGPFAKIDSTIRTAYLDSNDAAANNYYRISAKSLEESPPSVVSSGVRRLFPEAPYGVVATQGTDTSRITVTWDTVPGAQGYRIYRSMSDSFTTATLLGASKVCRFVDTVPSDSFYYYRIKSYNISGESSLSLITARGFRISRVVPGAPSELDTTDRSGAVILTWKMPSSTIAYSGFKIYRAASETGTYALIDETLLGITTYQDVPPSTFPTVYWYKVTAVNKKGEGAASNIVSATRR